MGEEGRAACKPQSSFIPFTVSPLSFFFTPATGDVTQLQLPANMETLNLKECDKLTGEFLVFVPRPSCGSGRKSLLFLYSFLSPSFFVR